MSLFGSSTTVPGVRLAATSPWASAVYAPSYPKVTGTSSVPAVSVPLTSAGNAISFACSAIGVLAAKPRAVQVRDPKLQAPNSAVVRVNVTSNDALSPGPSRIWSGVTTAVNPSGASTAARHVMRLRRHVRDRAGDGGEAGDVGDADRREVQVLRRRRVAVGLEPFARRLRDGVRRHVAHVAEVVVQAGVVDEAGVEQRALRAGVATRSDVARPHVERIGRGDPVLLDHVLASGRHQRRLRRRR